MKNELKIDRLLALMAAKESLDQQIREMLEVLPVEMPEGEFDALYATQISGVQFTQIRRKLYGTPLVLAYEIWKEYNNFKNPAKMKYSELVAAQKSMPPVYQRTIEQTQRLFALNTELAKREAEGNIHD